MTTKNRKIVSINDFTYRLLVCDGFYENCLYNGFYENCLYNGF